MSDNSNTDFYNFLKNSGYVKINIEPVNNNTNDENAKFEIKFSDKEKDVLKKYSYIQIILLDINQYLLIFIVYVKIMINSK